MTDTVNAVSVCIRNPEGLYLGVSRKDDPNAFGKPGGKVDPGETPEEAAIRELREETGLEADPSSLKLVYVGWCGPGKDGKSFYVATYTANVTGTIHTDEAGRVQWVPAQTLMDGPFGDYNRRAFLAMGLVPADAA